MKKVKILLADDHIILRDGVKIVLQTEANFSIVGEAGDGDAAVRLTKQLNPDIVILDINMPKINGIEAARKIKSFNTEVKILILTMHQQEDFIIDALAADINGYIFKMSDMDELINAVRSLASGKDYFPVEVSNVILSGVKRNLKNSAANIKPEIQLSKREKEILTLIANGNTSQEIAEKLFISYFTVSQHRKNILAKLNLKNTAEMVNFAIKMGLQ